MLNRLFRTKSEGSQPKKDKNKKPTTHSAPPTPNEHPTHTHNAEPTWKKNHYHSQAHMDFCKRWKVTGELQEYSEWIKFVEGFSYPAFTAAEIAFDSDLIEEHFTKLALSIKTLPSDICTETNLYTLFSGYLRMRQNDAVTMHDKIVNNIISKVFPGIDKLLWSNLRIELAELYNHKTEDSKHCGIPRSKSSM